LKETVLADKKEDRGVYRRVPVRIMGTQYEPVQPYLIVPKMEQLLLDFCESDEHIVTRLARFHIEFEYYVKNNLSAMETLFAGYVNSRLDSYLKILEE